MSPAAPVWFESMMSADQSTEATATLPRVAVPPRSQHPVLWLVCRVIEEGIRDSELVKSIDDNANRGGNSDPKHLPSLPPLAQRVWEYFNLVGNVILISVYTCRIGRFGTEPLTPSLLRHLFTSSMTLESTPC